MLYRNLTTKELYASIPNVSFIATMMEEGVRQGSTQLAVSAMEDLIRRRADKDIEEILVRTTKDGYMDPGTTMFSMVSSSLIENNKRELAAALCMATSGIRSTNPDAERAIRLLMSNLQRMVEKRQFNTYNPEAFDLFVESIDKDFSEEECREFNMSPEEVKELQYNAGKKAFAMFLRKSLDNDTSKKM